MYNVSFCGKQQAMNAVKKAGKYFHEDSLIPKEVVEKTKQVVKEEVEHFPYDRPIDKPIVKNVEAEVYRANMAPFAIPKKEAEEVVKSDINPLNVF